MSTTVWSLGCAALICVALFAYNYKYSENARAMEVGESTVAQTGDASACVGGCCGNDSVTETLTETDVSQSLVCTLDARDKAAAVAMTQEKIVEMADQVQDLDNGYRLHFSGATDDFIRELSNWIIAERTCCSFLRMSLTLEAGGKTQIEVTGPSGTKEFLRSAWKTNG